MKYSMYYKSFIPSHLNGFKYCLVTKTVLCLIQLKGFKHRYLTLTVQLHVSNLFSMLKCQPNLFDPLIGPYWMLPFRIRLDLGVIAIKRYFTFTIDPKLESSRQIV